jgi:hypothetical protein
MRRLGAGVTLSCTGVFEPEPLRDIFNLGFLFSGELTSFCASRAVVKALSFMGCGISSSELSPMSMFCIIGASAEKPCDCPSTESGESLLGRIAECERMRPYDEPPMGVGEAVAIATRWSRTRRYNRGEDAVGLASVGCSVSCAYIRTKR